MVIERLGSPEKFVRVSEAVTAPPDPPACWGIPSKPAGACACARVRAPASLRPCACAYVSLLTLTCALSQRKSAVLGFKVLASRSRGNGKRLALRKGSASVFRRCRSALQRTLLSPFALTVLWMSFVADDRASGRSNLSD